MLETPHVLTAASIAIKTPNPFLAVSLSFLSHFVLDATPHWNPHLTTEEGKLTKINPKTFKFVVVDSFISLFSACLIAFLQLPNLEKFWLVFICSFFSVLPDLVESPYIFFNYRPSWLKKWIVFKKKIQSTTNVFFGVVSQVLVITASIWGIFGY